MLNKELLDECEEVESKLIELKEKLFATQNTMAIDLGITIDNCLQEIQEAREACE